MKRTAILMLVTLVAAACGDTDVDGGAEAMADTTPTVEPVDLDTIAWFTEGRDVVFNDRTWIVAGEPVIGPVVERVGEFEGTPLYAETNTAPPYNALYVPLENDYWQLLEEGPDVPGEPGDTAALDTTGRVEAVDVDPTG
ncbi:MAG: hypothetical protein ACN0LA_09825 [Candidatus Longimicrobiales bacterium M2_2A_002]